MNTVVAISTAPGSGAINIIRLTGGEAIEIASRVFATKQLQNLAQAEHAKMYLGKILSNGLVVDTALAVCFFAPASFTGENVVELHCHGGYLVAETVLELLIASGAVPAARGEFSRRAFLNGKMDLAEAEGIADMIAAESRAGLYAANRLANGELSQKCHELGQKFEELIASIEATIDFPDDLEDENDAVNQAILAKINGLIAEFETLTASYKAGKIVRDGITVAIIGEPNVGKSSLLNALTGFERAIVSEIAGTTRDIVEGKMQIAGVDVKFLDTAGLRNTTDTIESIGVDRATAAAKNADIVIFVTEAGRALNVAELEIVKTLDRQDLIFVGNKVDLVGSKLTSVNSGRPMVAPTYDIVYVSAETKQGLVDIVGVIEGKIRGEGVDNSATLVTSQRHFSALNRILEALRRIVSHLGGLEIEFLVDFLRENYTILGEITGESATENVIDKIFSGFCVGK